MVKAIEVVEKVVDASEAAAGIVKETTTVVAENESEIANLVREWATAAGDAVKEHGPEAVNFALNIAQISAVQDFVLWLMSLMISIAIVYKYVSWFVVENSKGKEAMWVDRDREGLGSFILIFGGIACAFFALVFIIQLTFVNIFTIVGMFKPEVYLAAKALDML